MPGYADGFWQLRDIYRCANRHRGDATREEFASQFNATRDLYEQAQEEEMGSPAVQERGSKATRSL